MSKPSELDGAANETAPLVNTAKIYENGPVAVHAPVQLGGADAGMRLTLCRCGASANKPYCDGSHAKAEFAATGEPASKESPALETRGGPLQLSVIPDGPLKFTGPLEIVSGSGRTIERTNQTWLCRCGASANKPYCDGTHKRNGFKAP